MVTIKKVYNNNVILAFENSSKKEVILTVILVATTIIGLILLIMAIPMEALTTMLEVPPLNLKSCSKSLLVNKPLSIKLWRKSF